MKLSIRTLQFISMVFLLLMLLFTSLVGLIGMNDINTRLHTIEKRYFIPEQLIGDASASIVAWDRTILNYIMSADVITEHEEYKNRISIKEHDALTEIDKLASINTTKEEKDLVAKIQGKLSLVVVAEKRVIALSKDEKYAEARAIAWKDIRPLMDDIDAYLDDFSSLQKTRLESSVKIAREDFKHGVVVIISILVIAIMFTLGVYFFLSNKIVGGVDTIVKGLRQFAGGNHSARIKVKSQDELGYIADETNKMIERLEEIEKFRKETINMISHELRIPLAITKEGISLVLDKSAGEINEEQKEILNTVQNNVARMIREVNDLFDIARIETGKESLKESLIDVSSFIKRIITPFEVMTKIKGLELKIQMPDKPINVLVDEDKLMRVFDNLIGNALKFTEKGYIMVSVNKDVQGVQFSVEDTGRGISKEAIRSIFEKFGKLKGVTQDKMAGLGLGLPMSKQIIEMHNGKIWVESELGKGTKIFFTLPK